jgi:hypothetical protein
MGRPLKKLYFGTGENRLTVSDYRLQQGVIININTGVIILKQKSTNQFLVSGDTFTSIMTLVSKPMEQLNKNEFRIDAWDTEGNTYSVERIYNRTLRMVDSEGNRYKLPWSNIAESAPRTFSISFPSAAPVIVTDNNHGLVTGDTITINDTIPETINGAHTITVTGANTFTLDGTNGDDHDDSFIQIGSYTGAGSIATLETQ